MRFVLLLMLILAAPVRAATPVERHGALRVEGARILGSHGRPVTLRGMSLFWSQWQPRFYTARTVRWLRDDWRVDVVRAAIAVHHDGYLAHPDREWAKLETAVDAAVRSGLYVIVDWHAHEPEPEAAQAFFAKVARRWGHLPNLIYEPYNEPLPAHGWREVLKPYHQRVAAAIRAYDPDNLIVAGTRSWSQDVDEAAADPLPDANTAYTLHFYAGTHRGELRAKAARALALGRALFVTEWGTAAATGDGVVDEAETWLWWDFMEANGLSHANWSIADKVEATAALRPGVGVDRWPVRLLTPSGRLVRGRLRAMHARDAARPQRVRP